MRTRTCWRARFLEDHKTDQDVKTRAARQEQKVKTPFADLQSEYDSDSSSTSDNNSRAQIQPYMFEPRRAVVDRPNEEEENMDAEEDNDHRLGNLDW